MEIFHEMKKYQTSKTGNIIEMSIPLSPNEEGMVGRECPNSDCTLKYFQIGQFVPEGFLKNEATLSDSNITCPYCGHNVHFQKFHSESHKEWIASMIKRDIAITFQNILQDSVKGFKSSHHSAFSFEVSFKPGPLPNVRFYTEEKLRRKVVCDNCGFQYAVYGISFHCPLCGKGNLTVHLKRSVEITQVLIEESEKMFSEQKTDVAQRIIGNALEDVIGIFEGFLKNIYIYGIYRNLSKEEADKKAERIKVTFQRLDGAQKLFFSDLHYDVFSIIPEEERQFLEEQFLKRHVLTHNLGLVDEKYLEKANHYLRQGTELEILPNDVSHALKIVATIVENSAQQIIDV